MNKNSSLVRFTTTALMTAVIFVVTYMLPIPLPSSGGYLNIGDAPLYIAVYLLGGPAGAVAGAIGASMSDLALGYVAYALPTAVIKGSMGLVCGYLMRGGGVKRFALAASVGGAVMVGGYALFESLFFNVNQAIASVPWNCVQWAASVGVAVALFPAASAAGRSLRS